MLQKGTTFTNRDDTALVNLAKSGDDAAFEELIRRYYAKSTRLATSILRDSAEAEDVTQNCCLKAHRQLHQFKGESTFATWLGRIVVNQARSVRRYRHRHGTLSIDETVIVRSQASGEVREFSRSPEQLLGDRQMHNILSREIRLIPSIFRHVLVLKDLRELPLTEIASKLNLTVQTVKTRLFRGRKELRSRMLRYRDTP